MGLPMKSVSSSSPISTTTPASSCPSVKGQGSGLGQWPFKMCRSVPHTPQAPMRISAALGPTFGRGTVRITGAEPGPSNVATLTSDIESPPVLRARPRRRAGSSLTGCARAPATRHRVVGHRAAGSVLRRAGVRRAGRPRRAGRLPPRAERLCGTSTRRKGLDVGALSMHDHPMRSWPHGDGREHRFRLRREAAPTISEQTHARAPVQQAATFN